ncbi:hypothetical protein D3C78_968840 [compost metagenome]
MLAQADIRESFLYAFGSLFRRPDLEAVEWFTNKLPHLPRRVEGRKRVLVNQLKMPPYGPQRSAVFVRDGLVGNRNRAAFRLFEPQQQADRRRLAGAGFADEGMSRARRNRKRNIVHRSQGFAIDSEAFGDAADGDLWRLVAIKEAEPRIAEFGIALRVERGDVAMEFFGIG